MAIAEMRYISSKLQSDVRSGGAVWWMLTGWRPGVVCSLAAYRSSNC